jgi:capsular polysaccharide biosynthesis protein
MDNGQWDPDPSLIQCTRNETATTSAETVQMGTELEDTSSGTSPEVFIGVAFAVAAMLVAVVIIFLLLFCVYHRRRSKMMSKRYG